MTESNTFAVFVKQKRRELGITQILLAERAGVGLRFIRDLEQGKTTLRLDKIEQVLAMFGYRAGPVREKKPDEPKSWNLL